MSWLESSQCMLGKVGFDKLLFRIELGKLLGYLTVSERIRLVRWCRATQSWNKTKTLTPVDLNLPMQDEGANQLVDGKATDTSAFFNRLAVTYIDIYLFTKY